MNAFRSRVLLPLLVTTVAAASCAPGPEPPAPARAPLPLIPWPVSVTHGSGTLELGDFSALVVEPSSADLRAAVAAGAASLRRSTGLALPMGQDAWRGPHVRVRLTGGSGRASAAGAPSAATGASATGAPGQVPTRPGQYDESYTLIVTPEGTLLEAPAVPGILHGLRTLDQLAAGRRTVPAVTIRDEPRFGYRGLHLDVGRHVFPVEFVLRYIDLLARYKLNAFHWHLTEDQGWRIEIRRYPRLTEVGAWRAETMVEKNFDPYVGDGTPYGGFYTQEEVRRVVRHAARRGVTVIPEIEMPGHSRAALAAYPELGCTPGPFQVATRWGVFPEIYCPSEATFTFLENVLTEVMELFPSEYIHIGGDEAPKAAWEQSELAQEIIRREGLADEHELQSWFIRRIETFLSGHGRRLIGWDEILEGGLAPDATVMSWRGEAGGIEAARQGHDVIMTPNPVAYLDHYQGDPEQEPLAIGGFTPLAEVYAWEPVPDALSAAEARHVLGGQGNLWTEYIKTPEHVEYMIFPRLLALSEVLWSPPSARDPEHFAARLPGAFARLDALAVNYRLPDVRGLGGDRLVLGDEVRLDPWFPVEAGRVLLTTDGTEPDFLTPAFDGPRTLDVPPEGLTVAARGITADTRLGPVTRTTIRRTTLRPAASDPPNDTEPGLRWTLVEGDFRSVEEMGATPTAAEGVAPSPGFPRALFGGGGGGGADEAARAGEPGGGAGAGGEISGGFGLRFEGWFRAPEDGVYAFHLASDDGSRLAVGDTVVVDHDGLHGPSERSGQVALAAGLHRLVLDYFQAGGGRTLSVEVTMPGAARGSVAPWLEREAGER